MRVLVDDLGPIELSRGDFVATGGEGTVYARDGVAYKLLADPTAIDVGRLEALGRIRAPRVVLPERLVRDEAGGVIGFSMPFLADAIPFPRLCTRAFRDAVGLDPGRALHLVHTMRETVAAVHAAGALIVDLNPMNLLAGAALDAIWFIDAGSWALPGYPATAQLDAVRDRHALAFDPGTDWFAFAIVTFQLLVGVHPYRGTHPTLKGLDARMRADASVFRTDVRLPPSTFPLDVLPRRWRDWYEAVFERRLRAAPPAGGAIPTWTAVPSRHDLRTAEVARCPGVRAYAEGHVGVAVTADDVRVDGIRHALPGVEAVAFTPRGRPVFAWRSGGRLALADPAGTVPSTLRADALMTVRGRLVVRAGDQLVEVILHDGATVIAAPRVLTTVLPHATRLFRGIAVQDLHGAIWAHVPARPGSCYAVRLPALDGQRVVDAVGDGTVLAFLVADGARLDRWTFRFDARFRSHDLRVDPDVSAGLDLVVLDSGVAVGRGERGLELFLGVPGSSEVRQVDAPDGPLVRLGAQLGMIVGDRVVRLSLG